MSPKSPRPDEPRGAFDLNTPYQVTSDGRLGRRVQRQIAELETAAEEEAWIEEQARCAFASRGCGIAASVSPQTLPSKRHKRVPLHARPMTLAMPLLLPRNRPSFL